MSSNSLAAEIAKAFLAGYEACGDLAARAGLNDQMKSAFTPDNAERILDAQAECLAKALDRLHREGWTCRK